MSLLLIFFSFTHDLQAKNYPQRDCIILLDHDNNDNIGRDNWFLMSRLQSAIAEQSTPILLNINLWNSFVERRLNFKQNLQQEDSSLYKIHDLYQHINERIEYLSHQYNSTSPDVVQNKNLVVYNINQEFYNDSYQVTESDYQLLLDYTTYFDPNDWDIYKSHGFYLFIPKKYLNHHPLPGFNNDCLEKVDYVEDPSYNYFESLTNESIVNALSDFFLTYDDFPDGLMPYSWNILLTGHGGSKYKESNQNETVSWNGQPIVADLTVYEFDELLTFFQSKIKTHLFHYSSCYAGGNHIPLIYQNGNKTRYNFAIICDTLTDCASYCKWITLLPSVDKKFLTAADLTYNSKKDCWQLPLKPEYHWGEFFKDIASIDFYRGSIERLLEIMPSITYSIIANIPLICLPETNEFFPLFPSDVFKIDDRLLALAAQESNLITLNGAKAVLVESSSIPATVMIDHFDQFRVISIKPGNAIHYIKTLQATHHIDLPSTFWQAQFQAFDKTFILDECIFPHSDESLIFKEILGLENMLTLKNVIITQQKSFNIRIFFTVNDIAMMIVAHKPGQVEHKEETVIQEIVILSKAAQDKYQKYFLYLKENFN